MSNSIPAIQCPTRFDHNQTSQVVIYSIEQETNTVCVISWLICFTISGVFETTFLLLLIFSGDYKFLLLDHQTGVILIENFAMFCKTIQCFNILMARYKKYIQRFLCLKQHDLSQRDNSMKDILRYTAPVPEIEQRKF